jgi:hypothetical protein
MTKAKIFRAFAGLALVLLSFYGTLFILDYVMPYSRNGTRAEDAKAIKRALAAYFKKHSVYPGPADTPVDRLKGFLVDEKFLVEIPQDPLQQNPLYRYHYVSDGKTYYGLVVRFEPTTAPWGTTNEGACVSGIGTETTRAFGDPPPRSCAF